MVCVSLILTASNQNKCLVEFTVLSDQELTNKLMDQNPYLEAYRHAAGQHISLLMKFEMPILLSFHPSRSFVVVFSFAVSE